jgi:integrase
MAVKLTKRVVDGLSPRDSRFDVYDSDLPGFSVRITPDGAKSFSVLYRAGSGRTAPKRRVTLGKFGPLTVEEARSLARQTLADVARGADPATARATAKTAPDLTTLGVDFLADVRDRRKPATAREYERLWNKSVTPALGTRRVAEVAPADIARLHRSLRSTPYGANRVLSLLGTFFAFAERQGIRPKHSNPAHEVKPYKEESRERFLSQAEVMRLGEALTKAEREGLPAAPNRKRKPKTGKTAKHRPKSADKPIPANPFAVAAIRFLLLTGWREREALTLRWSDLDVERGVARLPDTKTGKSVRPIGKPALLLVDKLPRLSDSPFVFPGRSPDQPLVEINRVWYAVRSAAKLDDVRLERRGKKSSALTI